MKLNKLGVALFLTVVSGSIAYGQQSDSENFVCSQVPGKSMTTGGEYEGTTHIDSTNNLMDESGYAVIGKNFRNADGSEMGPFVLECNEEGSEIKSSSRSMPEKGFNNEAYARWMEKKKKNNSLDPQ